LAFDFAVVAADDCRLFEVDLARPCVHAAGRTVKAVFVVMMATQNCYGAAQTVGMFSIVVPCIDLALVSGVKEGGLVLHAYRLAAP